MSVAVIIVNYNSGLLLQKCLRSLAEQTVPADRIVIVDNQSPAPGEQQLLDEIKSAEVIRLRHNIGYGGAINAALESLQDVEFVCTLNPDACPEPRWLEALLNAARTHPEYGSYACLMLQADTPAIIDGAGDVMHISGIPWRRFHGRSLTDVSLGAEPVFSACGGAAMYRTRALNLVDGFDESYFMYVEDIDLGFRLQLAGQGCWFEPGAVVHHVGSAITGADSEFTIYHGHRNLVISYLKNMPLPILILTLPVHVAATLITMVVFSLRGKWRTIVRAKCDAYLDLPAIPDRRKSISRAVSVRYIWNTLTVWPFR